MPGQAPVTVDSAPQNSSAFVLKKIMNIPPPNILEGQDDDIEKEKQSSAGNGVVGGGVCGGSGGVSASLTPTIWDKTIPYDGECFHLEYMDLDEFLLENGIPVTLEEEPRAPAQPASEPAAAVPQVPKEALDVPKEEVEEEVVEKEVVEEEEKQVQPASEDKVERVTASPISPEDIEVNVSFQPDPSDLVLSSIPGGSLFNPRKHRFTADQLKPQPMIKKAKKVFVPEEAKDDKYWSRRKKNNVAAKRSRDARRLKENQIAVRASFLERENAALRQEVADLRKDCGRCRKMVSMYEAKYGAL